MAYVGETPWHGLGTKLEVAPSTTAEAMKLAGLDWQIGLEALQLADGTPVGERFAVVRQSDRSILGTVGKLWEPVQNEKAFAPFDPFLKAGLATVETAGSLRGGRRVWMLARIARPDAVIVPKADDRVAKYILVAIGHDGKMAFHMGITPTRVVCQNTLSLSLGEGRSNFIRLPHLSGANKAIEQVGAVIDQVDASIEESAKLFRALAGRKIRSEAVLRKYIEAVFPRKEAKVDGAVLLGGLLAKSKGNGSKTLGDHGDATKETKSHLHEAVAALFQYGKGNDLPGVKGTAWAAYNAVTEYLTWNRGQSADSRLDNLWFKDAATPVRALEAAREIFLAA
jgi:phage/plasmid-like protein (TIGR03299 family)